jgi:hypothetical protein
MRGRDLWTAIGIAAAIAVEGCALTDNASTGGECDGAYTNYGADVVDAASQPVTGLTISDSVAVNGLIFTIAGAEERPGHYVIMSTTGLAPELPHVTTVIAVRGTGGSKSFSQNYLFGNINSCIWGKLAGPDTIVAK